MIDITEEKPVGLIKAEEQLQKAANRLKAEKKKAGEEKRKQDTHNKIVMGGIVKKFFPDCIYFEQDELERILKAALQSEQCREEVMRIRKECSVAPKKE